MKGFRSSSLWQNFFTDRPTKIIKFLSFYTFLLTPFYSVDVRPSWLTTRPLDRFYLCSIISPNFPLLFVHPQHLKSVFVAIGNTLVQLSFDNCALRKCPRIGFASLSLAASNKLQKLNHSTNQNVIFHDPCTFPKHDQLRRYIFQLFFAANVTCAKMRTFLGNQRTKSQEREEWKCQPQSCSQWLH